MLRLEWLESLIHLDPECILVTVSVCACVCDVLGLKRILIFRLLNNLNAKPSK